MNLYRRLHRLHKALVGADGSLTRDPRGAPPEFAAWLRGERTNLESILFRVTQELLIHDTDRMGEGDEASCPTLPGYAAQLGLLEDLAAALSTPASDGMQQRVLALVEELSARAQGDVGVAWPPVSAHDVLLGDPAGLYAISDDDTRESLRRAAAQLARTSGSSEVAVAKKAVELSARALGGREVLRHVGYYLIGDGQAELEGALGLGNGPAAQRQRRMHRRPYLYVALICAVTLSGAALSFALLRASGAALQSAALLSILLFVPLLGLGVDVANWLASVVFYPPPRLPKIRFPAGIPADRRTAVIVPIMLHSPADFDGALQLAETNYRGNADPNLLYVLLTDFPDAAQQHLAGEPALLQQMAVRIGALNDRHAEARGWRPFHLLHRNRLWNPKHNAWMGWERKRGAVVEFNRLVLGRSSSYAVHAGEGDLRSVRYAMVLDADTRLPIGSAARLIGAMAHPLNAPELASDGRSLLSGFTIIQPRLRALADRNRPSRFSTWFRKGYFAGARYQPQDIQSCLFGSCIYGGKGIYEIAAFDSTQDGVIPDNALLSHDHIEGMHGRVGLAWDVLWRDNYPSNRIAFGRRVHRWVRGDWQVLPWLASSRFLFIDRWRLFENLRVTLHSAATFAAFVAGWLLLPPIAAAVWSAAVACIFGNQFLLVALTSPARALIGRVSWRRALWEALESLHEEGGRVLFGLTFLVFEASTAADAIATTLARLGRGGRQMLEWTPAAQAERTVQRQMTPRFAWREMRTAIIVTTAAAALVLAVNRTAVPAALPFCLLWFFSPQIAYWTALPEGHRD